METLVRVAVIYLFIIFGLRVMGKREFSQLSTVELVTLMLIPEIVSEALTGEDSSITNALVGVSTILLLVFFTSLWMHRSPRVEAVVSGSPVVLVRNGQIDEDRMNRERVSPGELYSEMHLSGVERLAEIRWAILEPDGKIAIITERPAQVSAEKRDHPLA